MKTILIQFIFTFTAYLTYSQIDSYSQIKYAKDVFFIKKIEAKACKQYTPTKSDWRAFSRGDTIILKIAWIGKDSLPKISLKQLAVIDSILTKNSKLKIDFCYNECLIGEYYNGLSFFLNRMREMSNHIHSLKNFDKKRITFLIHYKAIPYARWLKTFDRTKNVIYVLLVLK